MPDIQSLIFKYMSCDALSLAFTTSKINTILKEYGVPPLTEKQVQMLDDAENIKYAITSSMGNSSNGSDDSLILERIEGSKIIAKTEAAGICSLLGISEKAGLMYIHSAVASFKEYLKKTKGSFIPELDIEYRSFIIELLSQIDDEYKEIVTKEVISPSFYPDAKIRLS
jgi:hypothetical protein